MVLGSAMMRLRGTDMPPTLKDRSLCLQLPRTGGDLQRA